MQVRHFSQDLFNIVKEKLLTFCIKLYETVYLADYPPFSFQFELYFSPNFFYPSSFYCFVVRIQTCSSHSSSTKRLNADILTNNTSCRIFLARNSLRGWKDHYLCLQHLTIYTLLVLACFLGQCCLVQMLPEVSPPCSVT